MKNSAFHIMAKPVSYKCNLKCQYCFYLEKARIYPKAMPMSIKILKGYIKNYIANSTQSHVDFAWQGGEPMLAGLPFYQQAVTFQKKYSQGKTITNSFQTNGIALNDQWAEFFAKNNFLLGLSIDGDESIHDKYRISANGKPSFSRVKKAITLLIKHGVTFNTLTVVNNENWAQAEKVYSTLKALGSTHMQFIPLVERDDKLQTLTSCSVPSHGYGVFMARIFDLWLKEDIGKIFIQAFETLLAQELGYPAGVCIFSENCGDNLILEANGDLYSCDHFVYSQHLLGNIQTSNLKHLAHSQQQSEFKMQKSLTLSSTCKGCEFLTQCFGGCPKHRFIETQSKYKHNYLCSSYQQLFIHTKPKIKNMAKQLLLKQ